MVPLLHAILDAAHSSTPDPALPGTPRHRRAAAVRRAVAMRIGAVLQTLVQCGIDEDTLVVFSSDNGPEVTGPPSRGQRRCNSLSLSTSAFRTWFIV